MFTKKPFLSTGKALVEQAPFVGVRYHRGSDILEVDVLDDGSGKNATSDRITLFIDLGYYRGERTVLGEPSAYGGMFNGCPEIDSDLSDLATVLEEEPWYLHAVLLECDKEGQYPCHVHFHFVDGTKHGRRSVRWIPVGKGRNRP